MTMDHDLTYNVKFTDLPDVLPVFTLAGVVLLPHGQLPLNIFEPRYLSMIDQALRTDRLIGIIQPQTDVAIKAGPTPLQKIGCVGKIIEFKEHAGNRYTILLNGLWRFGVHEELPPQEGYRRVRPDWTDFAGDVSPQDCLGIDRERLRDVVMAYLQRHDMYLDCEKIDKTSDAKLITTLSMAFPLDAMDKQALLEARGCKERARMFLDLLEIAVQEQNKNSFH